MSCKYKVLIIALVHVTHLFSSECDPKKYNKSNKGQYNQAIKELPKLQLTGSEKVLDIGSGDGKVSSHIAKKYIPDGELVGIDNSEKMVSFALLHNQNSNTSYKCIDAIDYIQPNKFDVVVSFWTLHWITDYAKALSNISQCLKPCGKALLCHGVGTPLLRIIAEKLLDSPKWQKYEKDAKFLTYPSLVQVMSAIEKSNLKVDSLKVKTSGTWMPVNDVVTNWISLTMFNFIPAKFRKEYCREILERYTEEYPLNEKNEVFRSSQVISMILKKPKNTLHETRN